jgi:hypothetical protein
MRRYVPEFELSIRGLRSSEVYCVRRSSDCAGFSCAHGSIGRIHSTKRTSTAVTRPLRSTRPHPGCVADHSTRVCELLSSPCPLPPSLPRSSVLCLARGSCSKAESARPRRCVRWDACSPSCLLHATTVETPDSRQRHCLIVGVPLCRGSVPALPSPGEGDDATKILDRNPASPSETDQRCTRDCAAATDVNDEMHRHWSGRHITVKEAAADSTHASSKVSKSSDLLRGRPRGSASNSV